MIETSPLEKGDRVEVMIGPAKGEMAFALGTIIGTYVQHRGTAAQCSGVIVELDPDETGKKLRWECERSHLRRLSAIELLNEIE